MARSAYSRHRRKRGGDGIAGWGWTFQEKCCPWDLWGRWVKVNFLLGRAAFFWGGGCAKPVREIFIPPPFAAMPRVNKCFESLCCFSPAFIETCVSKYVQWFCLTLIENSVRSAFFFSKLYLSKNNARKKCFRKCFFEVVFQCCLSKMIFGAIDFRKHVRRTQAQLLVCFNFVSFRMY